ncbi:MAG: AmmeMemoRadiSam system radical SAM enzyme [Methanophagales archaeon ANME-1-THS]|nr:MAG: AmmeMemoRadiSam system radical SAM enzyme [Methanophagales archaeon ANME-1-THS]
MKTTTCVREALLYEPEGQKVRCKTCERFCEIAVGTLGFCKTRMNRDGKLYTLEYGDISSLSANPIEKKPFFHFFPGSKALTAGSYGCNFSCPWCQNWDISKSAPSRDLFDQTFPHRVCNYISPERFVRLVKERGCQGTSISFNEPTLLLEYSLDVFALARKQGYYNTFVTNGYMSADALNVLVECGLDAMNVDVKGCKDAVLHYCGADIEKVWRNIREAKHRGVHIEITTLVIPGVNDTADCLRSIASRIRKETGEKTPWHLTQYYPAYRSLELGLYRGRTPVETLERAWRLGKEEGLQYVYLGNVPGHPYENTYCPDCGELIIERYGFTVTSYRLTGAHTCPACGAAILVRS